MENIRLLLKCLESKGTFVFELPSDCTICCLRKKLSSSVPTRIRFSRDNKEEFVVLQNDTLQALGIVNGDLLYYSRDPFAFTSSSKVADSISSPVKESSDTETTTSSEETK